MPRGGARKGAGRPHGLTATGPYGNEPLARMWLPKRYGPAIREFVRMRMERDQRLAELEARESTQPRAPARKSLKPPVTP